MAVAGMHIRHDWQTFVEWDQKSVRTLCRKTSAARLTGIPGVTDQPDVMEVGGKKIYGWCTLCAVDAYSLIGDTLPENVHPYIYPMYLDVARITSPIYDAYMARLRRR